VSTIYDFDYATFEADVLSKFIDPSGTLDMRRQKTKRNPEDITNQVTLQMPQK